ncbi:hypothetical protein ONZ45_g13599 [Pleurotus djamor]|nr:hypothetical protein ONZ45_g13599 [Pleurotus djamor]
MLKQSKSNARRKSKKHSTPSTASPSPSSLPQFDHGADSEGARLAPVAYPISAEQRSENTSTSSNTSAISVSTSEAESHSEEATFPSTSTSEPLVVPIPETRELHDLFEHEHQHEYGYQHESEHVMMTPQSIGVGGMVTFEDPLIDFTAENQRTKYETPIYEPQIPQPSISPIPVISVPSTSVESESASSESPSLPSPQKKGRGRKVAAKGMATDPQGSPLDEPPPQPLTAPTVHHVEETLTPTPAPASLRLWETKGGSGDGETHMAPLSRKGRRSEHQEPSLPASPSSSTRQRTLKARPQIQHDPPSTLSHQYQAKSPADVITSDIHARRGSFGNRGYRHDSQDEESEEQFSPVQARHPQHRHLPRVSVPYGHSRSTSLGGYASHGMSDDDFQYQSVSPTGGSGSGHGRSVGGVGGVVGRVGGTVGGLISRGVSGISASKSLGAPSAIDRQYEGGGVDTTGRARGSGNAANVSQSSGRDQVLWSKWDVIMPSDRYVQSRFCNCFVEF